MEALMTVIYSLSPMIVMVPIIYLSIKSHNQRRQEKNKLKQEEMRIKMNIELEKERHLTEREKARIQAEVLKSKFCQYCKSENAGTAKFCESCGSKLFE